MTVLRTEIWVALAPPTSPNKDRWVIDIQGGAWCQDVASCASRAYNPSNCYLGSSNSSCFNADGERCENKSESMQFSCLPACNGARWCGGLLVNASASNPLSHDWNQVLFPYHDGQSFMGDREDPIVTTFNGQQVPLYFRGRRNFLAAVDYLLHALGMSGAAEVGLTGNSAGGLATYYHADVLASLLPPSTSVWAAPDSGFFVANLPGHPSWAEGLLAMVRMSNASSALNPACAASQRAAGVDPARCAFPEVLAPFIKTPLFVMNSRYDPALDSISGGEGGKNRTHVNEIGRLFVADVEGALLGSSSRNAAFITACAQHCGQWAQGSDGDFNVTMADGMQAVPALMQWRAAGFTKAVWVQAPGDTYPCSTCCSGGQ